MCESPFCEVKEASAATRQHWIVQGELTGACRSRRCCCCRRRRQRRRRRAQLCCCSYFISPSSGLATIESLSLSPEKREKEGSLGEREKTCCFLAVPAAAVAVTAAGCVNQVVGGVMLHSGVLSSLFYSCVFGSQGHLSCRCLARSLAQTWTDGENAGRGLGRR